MMKYWRLNQKLHPIYWQEMDLRQNPFPYGLGYYDMGYFGW